MEERVYNFSAGPAALPLPALKEVQEHFLALPGAGASIVEISHRSKTFVAILESAKSNVKELLQVPDNYEILFLHGGASLQFSMAPMNFLRGSGKAAEYVITGSWGVKALKEAKKEGDIRTAWDGKSGNYVRVPDWAETPFSKDAAYIHITTNETIQGVEFQKFPDTGSVPLVADASSDIMSQPIPVEKFGMIYAGAQKNMGPAGVALVILRKDLLDRIPEGLPALLDYKVMVEGNSLYNTPPTFGIYVIMLVTKWLRENIGGLGNMAEINRSKAAMLYDVIDSSDGFYKGHAQPESRSIMNVTWRLPDTEMEADFIKQAALQKLEGIKGHRSVGGCRASIYNAVSLEAVETLRDFMKGYQSKNG
jgi:phosphoserine aminotransferase